MIKTAVIRFAVLCLLAVMICAAFTGCSSDREEPITSLAQLAKSGTKIGVMSDMVEYDTLQVDYPEAQIVAYTDLALAYKDVENGRIDAFVYARREMELAMENGTSGVRLLEEDYRENPIAVGVSPKTSIPDLVGKLNSFIELQKSDGTLDDMFERWVVEVNEDMPDIPAAKDPEYHLIVGTTGTIVPFSYYVGTELRGYDIELAHRFAAWLGADLEFKIYDFAGIVSAASSGDIDCIMSNLFKTDINEKVIPFSEDLFSVEMTAMVRDTSSKAGAGSSDPAGEVKGSVPEYSSYEELGERTVSMLTGAPFEELVKSKAPNVREFSFFSSMPDMLLALKSKKTDAVLINNAIAELAVNRDRELALFPQNLQESTFGLAFAKGSAEREIWQNAFNSIPEETVKAAWKKWTGSDESVKVLPSQDWPGKNGTVRAAVCDTLEPMSYAGEGGDPKGFDLEMILLIARELDLHVEFVGMEFSAILAYVQSGKALVGAGSIIVTEERRQAVDFVEYYPASFVLIVRAAKDQGDAAKKSGFFTSIAKSFERTFIKENRWKLFLSGIGTTLLITVMSVLLGTALGFSLFMLCRGGSPVANTVTRFCVWLVQGMPVVVLLMILYYIIFGQVVISGTVVSIIGFTVIFGAGVFGMMKSGVGAVDPGQKEAALALGYTDRKAFYRVILPQALPHFLPAYRGEIVALIKATAIVGYVAVQDLTKMGDIVRSRTYEAFFPLIAVAVIYFVLAAILTFIVDRLAVLIDPRRRSEKNTLKGAKSK